MTDHYGIVGGGLLGLQLARRLRAAGHRVTVLEAGDRVGGMAAAWELGGVTWDRHYHVILLSDAHVQRLLSDIGLSQEFVGGETRTGFYTDGKLYSLSNSVEFLRFPPLGLVGKLRLGATIVRASRVRDWKGLENVPVVDWLTHWSGRRTTEKIWIPLLKSKLGDSYRDVSAAFIWAIIARMYAARRSGLKTEVFGYVRGGYARILRRLEESLTAAGVELRTGARVAAVEGLTGGGARVALADGDELRFDKVVVTAAAPLAAKLLPGLTAAERDRLDGVRYQGIVCASVLLKAPLAGFYVTNITDPAPFTGVIEMTALVDPTELGGRHLVYLPKYVAPDDPLFAEPDESIRERFLAALAKMYPHFDPADVLAFKVSRVRQVFAVSTLGYSGRVPPVATSVPGVYVVNSSQIVNGTLNVTETLQLADAAVPTLLGRTEAARAV